MSRTVKLAYISVHKRDLYFEISMEAAPCWLCRFWGKVMERSLPARLLLKSGDGAAGEWEVRERGKLRLLSKSWQRTESLRWTKRGKVEGWDASARREVQQKESCQERSEKRITITGFLFFLPFTDSVIESSDRRKTDWGTSHHFVHSQNICSIKKKTLQSCNWWFIYLFTCLLIHTTHQSF